MPKHAPKFLLGLADVLEHVLALFGIVSLFGFTVRQGNVERLVEDFLKIDPGALAVRRPAKGNELANDVLNTLQLPQDKRQVALKAGWHKVRIDFSQVSGRKNGLEWFWTRPGGVREVVPPSALRVGPDVSPDKAILWPGLPAAGICPDGP